MVWFKLQMVDLYKLRSSDSILTDDIPLLRHCRNNHSTAFQVSIANTDIYKCNFFPQTIRDWNTFPDSIISSAEGAEDS